MNINFCSIHNKFRGKLWNARELLEEWTNWEE